MDYVTNGSLHKVEHPGDYDLVIVDEAHKFRKTPHWLMKVCNTFAKLPVMARQKKVILYLPRRSTTAPMIFAIRYCYSRMPITSTNGHPYWQFFSKISKRYKAIIGKSIPGRTYAADEIYAELRDKIIEPLTVRRTRTDLSRHETYAQDLQEQGIRFPEVGAPEKLLYPLEAPLNQLYDETIKRIKGNEGLQYTRYRAIEFMKPEHARTITVRNLFPACLQRL